MKDTPDHIKKMQLQIWLAKSPAERLLQAIRDNEALFVFWEQAKLELAKTGGNHSITTLS
jgi:hypothetical protein